MTDDNAFANNIAKGMGYIIGCGGSLMWHDYNTQISLYKVKGLLLLLLLLLLNTP